MIGDASRSIGDPREARGNGRCASRAARLFIDPNRTDSSPLTAVCARACVCRLGRCFEARVVFCREMSVNVALKDADRFCSLIL